MARYSKLRMLENSFKKLIEQQCLVIETMRVEEFKVGQKVRVLCVKEKDFKPNGVHWHGEVSGVVGSKIKEGVIEAVTISLLPLTLECNNPKKL